MMGLHPTSVKDDFEEELEMVEYWLGRRKFYGIGEIGIDLYWDTTYLEEQIYVFRRQLKFASQLGLPVSIHTRDSFDVAFDTIQKEGYKNLKGVFHCFSGTVDQASAAVKAGFKIGVGGTVTFKNSGVDQIVSTLKPEDILLETDSPYLAPTPFRGKRNESSNLVYVLKRVSEILGLPEHDIAAITTQNATELFSI
jgi:TatD DNase family protein